MKKYQFLLLICLSLALTVACNGDADNGQGDEYAKNDNLPKDTVKFLANLELLEERINNADGIPSEKDLKEAVTSFQDYAALFPKDDKSPDYLLKAADFAYTLGKFEKSVLILENIIENHPAYDKMESVKYNRASHLDFELRDTTRAKEAYKDFIQTYPNSPMVADCESRIANIKYSLEELTQKFLEDLENGNGTESSTEM